MLLTILLIALGLIGFAVYLVYKYAGADGLSRFKTNLWHEVQTILVISISLYVFSSAYVYILKNHMFHNYYECEPFNAEKHNVKANFYVQDEVMRVYRSDSIGYDEYTLEKEDIKWENFVIAGNRLYSKMLPPDEVRTFTLSDPRAKYIWKYGREVLNPNYDPKIYTIDRKYIHINYTPKIFWTQERTIYANPDEDFSLFSTLSWTCDWKMRIFPRQVSTP